MTAPTAIAGLAVTVAPAVLLRGWAAMVLPVFVIAVAFRPAVVMAGARGAVITALVFLRAVVAQQIVAGKPTRRRL
ncbi:MAG: hypothetical protein KK476_09735, partial [Sinorhizobium fredii]|nr:hypothetical protein [Sinorhizobium fredii]